MRGLGKGFVLTCVALFVIFFLLMTAMWVIEVPIRLALG